MNPLEFIRNIDFDKFNLVESYISHAGTIKTPLGPSLKSDTIHLLPYHDDQDILISYYPDANKVVLSYKTYSNSLEQLTREEIQEITDFFVNTKKKIQDVTVSVLKAFTK